VLEYERGAAATGKTPVILNSMTNVDINANTFLTFILFSPRDSNKSWLLFFGGMDNDKYLSWFYLLFLNEEPPETPSSFFDLHISIQVQDAGSLSHGGFVL
jgi:hypothetical protein